MPDLNLIDEGGFDESSASVAPRAKKKSSGGWGGGKTFLILIILVLIVAGVYLLNQKGIIKLWGKKQPPIAQVQEEQFPQEPFEQFPQEQADTNEINLLETQPIEGSGEIANDLEAKAAESSAKKPKEDIAETEAASKLSEMKGEFTIQVVAYYEKKKAEEMVKRLEFSGYPSFVEKVPMKGRNLYTVRIGRYPSRNEAKKAVKSFAAQLQERYVIDKIRTK